MGIESSVSVEGAPQRLFSVHHGVRVKGSRRVTIHFTGYKISQDAVFPHRPVHALARLYPMTMSLQPLSPKDLYGSARSQRASLGASSTVLATRLDSLRTVVMPHLSPDIGSVPTHLDPSLKAMSRSNGTAFQEPPQPRAREEMTW